MPLFAASPFEDLVAKATSEQNVTDDWSTIMEICDKVVNFVEGPKYFLQAIGKRLYHKVPRVVMQSLLLLDACVKNCGKKFHLELSSRHFVDQIPKLLSKMHDTAALKFKQLLRKWSEEDFKNDPELGLIPSLYYKLKSEGVDFPLEQEEKVIKTTPISMDPDVVSSQEEEEDIIKAIALSLKDTPETNPQASSTTTSIVAPNSVAEDVSKVRALYDFEAVEDNELTIIAGEIVIIIDKSNSSWWRGTNHRGEGYFPANFVTEDLDAPIVNESKDQGHDEEETLPKQIDDDDDELLVAIDEEKIDHALDWLNGIDPITEIDDPTELLALERYCYAMSPLIDEKLQEIDKRCTALNSVNTELVNAVKLFYELNSSGSNMFSASGFSNAASVSKTASPKSQRFIAQQQQHYIGSQPLPTQYVPITNTTVPQGGATVASAMTQNSIHYQPVFTMVPSSVMDPRYQVVLTNVPSPQGAMTESSEPRPETSTSETVDTNESQSSNIPVYQSLMMPTHFQSSNNMFHGGISASSYSSLPVQLSTPYVYPQSVNTFMPQYIAQVGISDGNPYIVPQTHPTDSSTETTVSNASSKESETPVSKTVTVQNSHTLA